MSTPEEYITKKKTGWKTSILKALPGRRGKPNVPDIEALNNIAAPSARAAAYPVAAKDVNKGDKAAKDLKKGAKHPSPNNAANKKGAVPRVNEATTPVVDADAAGAKAKGQGGRRRHKQQQLAPHVPYSKDEIEDAKKGMSPFVSTLLAGGILLSVYVLGKAAYKWFTTRRNAKKQEPSKRTYTIQED